MTSISTDNGLQDMWFVDLDPLILNIDFLNAKLKKVSSCIHRSALQSQKAFLMLPYHFNTYSLHLNVTTHSTFLV